MERDRERKAREEADEVICCLVVVDGIVREFPSFYVVSSKERKEILRKGGVTLCSQEPVYTRLQVLLSGHVMVTQMNLDNGAAQVASVLRAAGCGREGGK